MILKIIRKRKSLRWKRHRLENTWYIYQKVLLRITWVGGCKNEYIPGGMLSFFYFVMQILTLKSYGFSLKTLSTSHFPNDPYCHYMQVTCRRWLCSNSSLIWVQTKVQGGKMINTKCWARWYEGTGNQWGASWQENLHKVILYACFLSM